MKRTFFIAVIFFIVTLAGCQSISPRAELRIGQLAFEGVVVSLTDLQQTGQIGDDERMVIGRLIHSGRDLLAQWTEHVIATGERPKLAEQFHAVLGELVAWEIAKKGER